MKTLRQLRDELATDVNAMYKAGASPEYIKTRIMDTVTFIENCTEEEFKHLGLDVPEEP